MIVCLLCQLSLNCVTNDLCNNDWIRIGLHGFFFFAERDLAFHVRLLLGLFIVVDFHFIILQRLHWISETWEMSFGRRYVGGMNPNLNTGSSLEKELWGFYPSKLWSNSKATWPHHKVVSQWSNHNPVERLSREFKVIIEGLPREKTKWIG